MFRLRGNRDVAALRPGMFQPGRIHVFPERRQGSPDGLRVSALDQPPEMQLGNVRQLQPRFGSNRGQLRMLGYPAVDRRLVALQELGSSSRIPLRLAERLLHQLKAVLGVRIPIGSRFFVAGRRMKHCRDNVHFVATVASAKSAHILIWQLNFRLPSGPYALK